MPPRKKWRGPQIYLKAIETYAELTRSTPCHTEAILSTPIWYNKEYLARIKKIILKEKYVALFNNKYDAFDEKWEKFTFIYDYRGPDVDTIS